MSHSHHHGGTKQSGEAEPSWKSLERMNRFQEPEARRIIEDLGLPPGSRGLDVGCGVGLYGLWLAEAIGNGGHVVGIEPEEERGEAAPSLGGGRLGSKRVAVCEGDGTRLPAPCPRFG